MSREKLFKLFFLVFAFLVLFLTALSFVKPLAQDEGVFLTISRNLLTGKVPYRDFFDHKPPGIYFLLAPFSYFFGTNYIFPKILLFLTNFLTACSLFVVSERIKKGTGLYPFFLYLFSLVFFEGNFLIAEPFMAFLLSFVALIWVSFEEQDNKNLFFLGILSGILLMFKQTTFLSIVPIFVYLLLSSRKKMKSYFLGLLGVFFLLCLFVVSLRTLNESFSQIILLNFTAYPAEPLPKVLKSLAPAFKRTWPFWFFAFWGLFTFFREKQFKLLIFLSFLPVISFFVRPYPHYWIQVLPFWALFAGLGLAVAKEKTKCSYLFLLVFFLALFSTFKNTQWSYWIYKNIHLPKVNEEMNVQKYLDENSSKYLLAENQFTGFYFLFAKKPLTKYLYLTEITEKENAEKTTLDALKSNHVIILWPNNPDFAYSKTLQEYIQNNYRKIKSYESLGVDIYE